MDNEIFEYYVTRCKKLEEAIRGLKDAVESSPKYPYSSDDYIIDNRVNDLIDLLNE